MNLWGRKLGFHAAKDLDEALIEKMRSHNDEAALDEWQHATLHSEIQHSTKSKII
jgi:hypothetical protein